MTFESMCVRIGVCLLYLWKTFFRVRGLRRHKVLGGACKFEPWHVTSGEKVRPFPEAG
jgi:hypothetical protein